MPEGASQKPARRGGLRSATVLMLLGGWGCSAPPPPEPPAPPPDAGRIASLARAETQLDRPTRILFEWTATERDGRFGGTGLARIEPPYRARLDLFLGNGETVTAAALVGSDLRIPRGMSSDIIPPHHLLWAALGVFQPGGGATLLPAEDRQEEGVILRYRFANDEQMRYRLAGGRIQEAELLRGGDVVQRVSLELDQEARYLRKATYRDLSAFVELTITRESVEYVESYSADIWNPIR